MDRQNVISLCKERLLQRKVELMGRIRAHQRDFSEREPSSRGDEGDQSLSVITEHQLFVAHQILRQQLFEVESALSRIENSRFGICEETEEEIEAERLLAIPWTRLSLEGAEIRESQPLDKTR